MWSETTERQPLGFLGSVSDLATKIGRLRRPRAPSLVLGPLHGKWEDGPWRVAREEQLLD